MVFLEKQTHAAAVILTHFQVKMSSGNSTRGAQAHVNPQGQFPSTASRNVTSQGRVELKEQEGRAEQSWAPYGRLHSSHLVVCFPRLGAREVSGRMCFV